MLLLLLLLFSNWFSYIEISSKTVVTFQTTHLHHLCVHVCTCRHVGMRARTHARTHIHTNTHIHTHTYARAHTHTQARAHTHTPPPTPIPKTIKQTNRRTKTQFLYFWPSKIPFCFLCPVFIVSTTKGDHSKKLFDCLVSPAVWTVQLLFYYPPGKTPRMSQTAIKGKELANNKSSQLQKGWLGFMLGLTHSAGSREKDG